METLLKSVAELLERSKFGARLQPAFALLCVYLAAAVLGHQYVAWRYGLDLPLDLYLRSYVFVGITVCFAGLLVIGAASAAIDRALRPARAAAAKAADPERAGRTRARLARRARARRATLLRAVAAALTVVLVVLMLRWMNPHQAGHIRVRFLGEPDFDVARFTYLVYELNRAQRNWHFEVDFTPLKRSALSPFDAAHCQGRHDELLCQCTALVGSQPTVVVTALPLGDFLFWTHRGHVSVVSTAFSAEYAPVDKVEFLLYCLIVQGAAIHLDATGDDTAAGGPAESSSGSLLEFSPPLSAFKARLLSAHLSPADERRLLNRFGLQYYKACAELMTLRWMRTGDVADYLERYFPATTQPAGGGT